MRSAVARNFSSRSPAIRVTGIVSSPSRSHSGSITPVPRPRSAVGESGRRVAQPVGVGGRAHALRLAGEQRRARPTRRRTPRRRSARCGRPARRRTRWRSARSPASARPGLAPIRISRSRSGARARRGARSARPSSSRRASKPPGRERPDVGRAGVEARRCGGRPGRGRAGRAPARDSVAPSARTVRRQLWRVWVKPCSRTSVRHPPHHARNRHLYRPACLRRRARPLRPARGVHLPRLALDAAGAVVGVRVRASARPRTSTSAARRSSRSALAKASGRPAALACTSGTAAANYAPAVIEAHEARVPLLVLTADRPSELRDVGAGQTIDQLKLYGERGQVVHRGRRPSASPAPRALDAPARLPRVLDRARGPARAGAPQLLAARAAGPRRRAAGPERSAPAATAGVRG